MKKILLISACILFAISSSFAYQSPVTCGVTYCGNPGYPGGPGAFNTQYVTVQQNCDIILEAETTTIGFAVAQYGSTYAYADTNKRRDARMITSVSAGSTIYLHAMVSHNGCGFSYARVTFGRYH